MRASWVLLCLGFGCAGPSNSAVADEPAPLGLEAPCPERTDVRVRGECLDPTGERDAVPALARIIAAMPERPRGLGSPLQLPENAVLRLEDADGDGVAWRIDRQVIVRAEGAVLHVSGDYVGLRLTEGARWSSVRDLTIEGRGHPRGGIGLDIRAHGVRLDNVWLRRIHTGIRSHSRLVTDQACETDEQCECDGRCQCRNDVCTNYTNANTQQWGRVLITACHTGIALRGSDANGSLFSGVEVLSTPNAITDDSFLGNVYVGPSIEGSPDRSIGLLQGANYSTVVGGYIERDSARAETTRAALFVGGNAVSWMDGRAERVGSRASQLTFRDLHSNLRVRIPGGPETALWWEHPDEGSRWQLQRFPDANQSRWGFSHRGSRGRTYYFSDQVPGLNEWRQLHPPAPPPPRLSTPPAQP